MALSKCYTRAAIAMTLAALCSAVPAVVRTEAPEPSRVDSARDDRDARSLPDRVTARLGSNRLRPGGVHFGCLFPGWLNLGIRQLLRHCSPMERSRWKRTNAPSSEEWRLFGHVLPGRKMAGGQRHRRRRRVVGTAKGPGSSACFCRFWRVRPCLFNRWIALSFRIPGRDFRLGYGGRESAVRCKDGGRRRRCGVLAGRKAVGFGGGHLLHK